MTGRITVLALLVALLPLKSQAKEGRGNLSPASSIEVCFLPFGSVPEKTISVAARGAEHLFGFTTRILEEISLPEEAYYKPRKRYRAEKLLDYIDAKVTPSLTGCTIIVGITRVDISTTKEPYEDWGILGLGSVGGRSAVVSTFRTGRDKVNIRKRMMRLVKVVNHEIGHVLGLPHVSEKGCLMQDAEGTIKTVDGESGLLCESTITWIEENLRIDLPEHTSFPWDEVLGK